MPLSAATRRAWRATDYRVRLASGGYASIRCGRPLPPQLSALLSRPDDPWGYITAWNPGGVKFPTAANRGFQRRLRDELQAGHYRCFAGVGVGVGAGSWREHSLFVPGIPWWKLDVTARRFGQLGVVRGIGREPAQLHVLMFQR